MIRKNPNVNPEFKKKLLALCRNAQERDKDMAKKIIDGRYDVSD